MDTMATMWLDLPLKGNRNYLESSAIWERLALGLLDNDLDEGNRSDIEAEILHLRFRKPVQCAAKVIFGNAAARESSAGLVTGQVERPGSPKSPITIIATDRPLRRKIPENENAFLNQIKFDGNIATVLDYPLRNLADLYVVSGRALVGSITEPTLRWIVTSIRLPLEHALRQPSRIQLTITHMARGSSRGVCDIHAYGLCHPGGRLLFMRAPIGWQGGS